jgi:2-polyprenyl-6-methoxyphenol hydroxylase-like FAD-dependent oxidoreductase
VNSSEQRRAIVVGAGIGGLTAALALRRAGLDVVVVEREPRLREVPAAVALGPGAVEILRGLGLGEAVEAVGSASEAATVRTWRGRQLAAASPPLLVVQRQFLHTLLDGALDPDPVRLGARVVRVSQRERRATLHLADRSWLSADFVVGADGAHSVVRAHLADEPHARYSGFTAWQGIAPLRSAAAADLDPGVLYGPGATFGIARLPGHQAYWWATAYTPWRERDARTEQPELLARFREWEALVPMLVESTPSSGIVRTPLFARAPLRSLALGRVALLGDAAHPMLPVLAQGASQAIEDAAALAEAVAETAHTQEALDLYSARRLRRTNATARRSQRAARISHLRNPVAVALRNAAARVAPTLATPHREAA